VNIKNIAALILATLIAEPVFATVDNYSPEALAAAATQSAGLTRAQVRDELIQLENAGYTTRGERVHYPDGIQAAEAKVAAQNAVASSYGGVADGVSASGAPAAVHAEATGNTKSIYFGH
jgi:hypothetical protein